MIVIVQYKALTLPTPYGYTIAIFSAKCVEKDGGLKIKGEIKGNVLSAHF